MKSYVLILFVSQQQGLIGSLVRLQSSQAETLVQKHKLKFLNFNKTVVRVRTLYLDNRLFNILFSINEKPYLSFFRA